MIKIIIGLLIISGMVIKTFIFRIYNPSLTETQIFIECWRFSLPSITLALLFLYWDGFKNWIKK